MTRHPLPLPPQGFSLIEVMLTGIVVILMILGFSQILSQGLSQKEQRSRQGWILGQMDQWNADLLQSGFDQDDLFPGVHQKIMEDPGFGKYQMNWQVAHPEPLLKIVTFTLQASQPPSTESWQWRITVPAWKEKF